MPITNAKDLAQEILTQLGQDFTIPPVDLTGDDFTIPAETDNPLYAPPAAISLEDLTSGAVGGDGAFDRIMASNKAHLVEQYEKNRITGDQYAKAYIELTTAALSTGLQMVLGKDTNYWQALLIQMQGRRAEIEAITAKVQLETAKAQLAAANRQAELANAQYVLTLMQVASEDAKYLLAHKQIELVQEQIEAARAQTLDTRTDGITPVAGSIGKQKDLYTQQIDSYQKDAKQKVAKMFSDGWSVQKTVDEGTPPPNQYTQANIDAVLTALRTDHGL